ncbi:invasion associated locus B family protein [Paracoccus sp. M683]|uniref:invasion associated locus B family protein n=1 Tax=Paracoccus sp. M683 TaxID=2594268 RepID=UPI0011801B89|nr:invasion associated locus B family protein [Paracoccus sp. M683]TRW96179.1 invasion associated locus B family protein [Paracoccus sp. M683]
MAYKNSSALLAAIVVMAGPAFAQDNTATPLPEGTEATTEQAADSAAPATGDAAATTEGEAAATTDEAAAAEPAAETAPADAPAATADAPAAAPADAPADAANAEPQIGAYYVKSTHSDWTIRCVNAGEGEPDPCELYQLLKDGQGNSVAEVTMIPLAQGEAAAGATIVAPLETDLVRGLGLKIDSAQTRGYPFNFCAPVGCISRMGFDTAGLNGLKRGNAAVVSLLPFGADPENPVELPMSLSGFTAAFSELEGIVDEARAELAARESATEAPAEGAATEETAPAN